MSASLVGRRVVVTGANGSLRSAPLAAAMRGRLGLDDSPPVSAGHLGR
jgi:hypothetical protein